MRPASFLIIGCLALAACKSDSPPQGAVPSADSTAISSATAAPETAAPVGEKATASELTIDGVAVGRVDVEELQKSLEKRGYVHEGGRKFAMGDLETVVVKGKLGDAVTAVTVVRPTAKPKHDRFALASPESKLESFRKTGAGLLDGGIVIGVEVEGDQAKARALLDDLVDGPPRQNLSPGG